MNKTLLVILGVIILGVMIVVGNSEPTTPSNTYKTAPVTRLSDLERRTYIGACVDAAEGIEGAYEYCECTLIWFENNSVSNEALRAEMNDYDDSYTPRMNQAIDSCAYKLGL